MGLTALQLCPCGCAVKVHTGVKEDLSICGAAGMDAGVIRMLVQGWGGIAGRRLDGLEALLLGQLPGMGGFGLRREFEEQRRERAYLEDA